MSDNCSHNCSSCSSHCASKAKQDFMAKPNAASKIKRVIAVASGKGGVGKSFVTAMLAVEAAKAGLKVGILDADITGPSVPKAFGLTGGTVQNELGIEPACTTAGIRVMSLNMLVDDPTDPVVWRGPVIAGAVKQFWSDVHWGDIDIMFVDMPPGTGDVPLTVYQSLPVDGVVIVTTPQELVGMIVGKSVRMARMMDMKVLGLVENMSYLECTKCGERLTIFGESKVEQMAKDFGIDRWVRLPIKPGFADMVDSGAAEHMELPEFADFAAAICADE